MSHENVNESLHTAKINYLAAVLTSHPHVCIGKQAIVDMSKRNASSLDWYQLIKYCQILCY